MRKIILLLVFICLVSLANAQQPTFSKVLNAYSGSAQAFSIVNTVDNKYMIAGVVDNEALVCKNFLKIDYPCGKTTGLFANFMMLCINGNFHNYLFCNSALRQERRDFLRFFKIDTAGAIIWSRMIGNHSNESFSSITTTRDSCYVLAGSIYNTVNSNNDILCIKVNSNGDTLWAKAIDMGYNDYALAVQQTYDNGYILVGYSSQSTLPLSMIAIVKLDAGGNLTWENFYKRHS
jgi:hypothetical protein